MPQRRQPGQASGCMAEVGDREEGPREQEQRGDDPAEQHVEAVLNLPRRQGEVRSRKRSRPGPARRGPGRPPPRREAPERGHHPHEHRAVVTRRVATRGAAHQVGPGHRGGQHRVVARSHLIVAITGQVDSPTAVCIVWAATRPGDDEGEVGRLRRPRPGRQDKQPSRTPMASTKKSATGTTRRGAVPGPPVDR